MRIIRTTDPFPTDRMGQLALYNGLDVLSLFEIHSGLMAEMDQRHLPTYRFEMDLQAALLEMSFNGLPVDLSRRQLMIQQTEREKAKVDDILHQLCDAIGFYQWYLLYARQCFGAAIGEDPTTLPASWAEWLMVPVSTRREWKRIAGEQAIKDFQKALKEAGEPFNANSPAQKLQLFYHFFGSPSNTICETKFPDLPPPWNKTHGLGEYKSRGTNGEYTPSADREALEKILAKECTPDDAAYWAQPFAQCCLVLADLNKTLGFLNCRLEDGIFRSSFGSVTDTGRLNSKKNAQGYGWNAQNVAPKLRSIFTAPLGYKLSATDYAQIESRCVAARCFTQFGATAYINATECGDLHSLACSMVWPQFDWPSDFTLEWLAKHGPFPKDMLKAAKIIAGKEFYRGKSYRDVSKTLGHGTSYMGKPPQMSKHSHIPVKYIEHYQEVFFSVFPEMRQWHNWVIEQIQVHGEMTTLLGRTRQFHDRPSDDSTIRKAVAFEPQSMGADYTNTALLQLLKASIAEKLPIQLRVQKHDELLITFEEKDEDVVIPKIAETMEHRLILKSPTGVTREWYVPAEPQVGWNLGKRSPSNPDGLVDWPDSRTRTENPFSLLG